MDCCILRIIYKYYSKTLGCTQKMKQYSLFLFFFPGCMLANIKRLQIIRGALMVLLAVVVFILNSGLNNCEVDVNIYQNGKVVCRTKNTSQASFLFLIQLIWHLTF